MNHLQNRCVYCWKLLEPFQIIGRNFCNEKCRKLRIKEMVEE